MLTNVDIVPFENSLWINSVSVVKGSFHEEEDSRSLLISTSFIAVLDTISDTRLVQQLYLMVY